MHLVRFVSSPSVIRVIDMAKQFDKLPSEIVGIDSEEDSYTAWCLNEACSMILDRLEQGEEPHFKKEYRSFSDLYKQFE